MYVGSTVEWESRSFKSHKYTKHPDSFTIGKLIENQGPLTVIHTKLESYWVGAYEGSEMKSGL